MLTPPIQLGCQFNGKTQTGFFNNYKDRRVWNKNPNRKLLSFSDYFKENIIKMGLSLKDRD